MLSAGTEWLAKQLDGHLAEEVTYRSPSGTVTASAVMGSSTFDAESGDGPTVRFGTADFIFASDAIPFRPARGDRIVFRGTEYEVICPPGEPEWRWTSGFKKAMRVHTKRRN